MTFQSASLRYLRWPYQAKVMKMFEIVSNRMVRTKPPSECDAKIKMGGKEIQLQASRNAGRPEAANVDGFIDDLVIDQPVSGVKEAVPANAAFDANAVHVRE